LTGIGLLAFLLYVLACRPDGTKILVPIYDAAHTSTAVWVYDRGQQSWSKGDYGIKAFPGVTWTGDGREAVVVWGNEESNVLQVVTVPMAPVGPVRRFALQPADDRFIYYPPPVQGHYFYHGSSNEVYRLDLRNGSVATGDVAGAEGVLIHVDGPRLPMFVRRDKQIEFCLLDGESLSYRTVQRLPASIFSNRFYAVGERVVCVEEKGVALYHRNVRAWEAPMGASFKNWELIPGPSTEVLYAAALRGRNTLCVGEIHLRDGSIRWTPLCPLTVSEGNCLMCFLALSPDGRTLALSTGLVEKGIAPADRALYLVDLTTPTRKVTKVPLPVPPTAEQ
jgi:hypothetical protein